MTDNQAAVIMAMNKYAHSLEWITYQEIRRHTPIAIKKREILEALASLVREGRLKQKGAWWGFKV